MRLEPLKFYERSDAGDWGQAWQSSDNLCPITAALEELAEAENAKWDY